MWKGVPGAGKLASELSIFQDSFFCLHVAPLFWNDAILILIYQFVIPVLQIGYDQAVKYQQQMSKVRTSRSAHALPYKYVFAPIHPIMSDHCTGTL